MSKLDDWGKKEITKLRKNISIIKSYEDNISEDKTAFYQAIKELETLEVFIRDINKDSNSLMKKPYTPNTKVLTRKKIRSGNIRSKVRVETNNFLRSEKE